MSKEIIMREAYQVKTTEGQSVDFTEFQDELMALAEEKGISKGDIKIAKADSFPSDESLLILLAFLSKVAYDVWVDFIWPTLKEKYLIKKSEEE